MAKRRVKLLQRANGLNLQYDPTERPEGSLTVAENVLCQREGMTQSRRGLDRYGAAASAVVRSYMEFKRKLLRHVSPSTLQYDSDGAGTWANYTAPIDPPLAGRSIRGVEAREQLFFTSLKGLQCLETLAGEPVRAGVEQGLDCIVSESGTGDGPVQPGNVVGYKILWGRKNSYSHELRGRPSFPDYLTSPWVDATYSYSGGTVTVTSTAHGYTTGDSIQIQATPDDVNLAGTFTITVTGVDAFTYTATGAPTPTSGSLQHGKAFDAYIYTTVPDDVVEGDYFEVYRTAASGADTVFPTEHYYLVERVDVTGSDVVSKEKYYIDETPEDFLGAPLYTNTTAGANPRPNDRPPFCRDVALYAGHLLLAGATWEQEVTIQMRSMDSLVNGTSYIRVGAETYTFEAAENVLDKEFERYTAYPTLAQNIEATMRSFCKIVNRASSAYYAYYASLPADPPGRVILRHRPLNGSPFSLVADATATGENFTPQIPTTGTTVSSSAPGGSSYFAISKFEEPHAVPRLSLEPLGGADRPVERILALREAAVIFKEIGVWVLSGESDGTVGAAFQIKARDTTLRLRGPNTPAVLHNRAHAYSDQGFVAADQNGVEIVGRQVEDGVEERYQLTPWEDYAFGVAYPSDNLYLCFAPHEAADSFASRAWSYNALTEKWTHGWVRQVTAGIVLSSDDKLYLSHAQDYYTLRERKGFSTTLNDFCDEAIGATITAITTTTNEDGKTVSLLTVTFTYTHQELTEGWRVEQLPYSGEVDKVTRLTATSFDLRLTEQVSDLTTGACNLVVPIYVEIEFSPVVGRNAALLKQFTEVHFDFEEDRALRHYVGFSSDIYPTRVFNTTPFRTENFGSGWGESSWGDSPWGDGSRGANPLILHVPSNYQRGRRLKVAYRHHVCKQQVALTQLAVMLRDVSMRSSLKVPR